MSINSHPYIKAAVQNFSVLKRIQPDIIGVRGMVCGVHRTSVIKAELVEKLKNEM